MSARASPGSRSAPSCRCATSSRMATASALTLVNIGRGECLWATVVAAAHGAQSRPVEIGSLPPIRDGHPGTAVDIPMGPAAKGFEAFPVWLRVSYADTLGERRVSLRLPGAGGGEDASGARAAEVATAG